MNAHKNNKLINSNSCTQLHMTLRQTPDEYLFNLEALTAGDSKRLWREKIKENWGYQCAYCGSTENLTLDHIKPRSLGGEDVSSNVLCSCHSCNQSKGHREVRSWYESQEFYSYERMNAIDVWMNPIIETGRYAYGRKTRCYANA